MYDREHKEYLRRIKLNKLLVMIVQLLIVVGFILNSGIDYTAMQECLMRFETSGDILGDIDFKMNISFYSDF
jgi:hypothetical protein